jgi:hypothetical protein
VSAGGEALEGFTPPKSRPVRPRCARSRWQFPSLSAGAGPGACEIRQSSLIMVSSERNPPGPGSVKQSVHHRSLLSKLEVPLRPVANSFPLALRSLAVAFHRAELLSPPRSRGLASSAISCTSASVMAAYTARRPLSFSLGIPLRPDAPSYVHRRNEPNVSSHPIRPIPTAQIQPREAPLRKMSNAVGFNPAANRAPERGTAKPPAEHIRVQ